MVAGVDEVGADLGRGRAMAGVAQGGDRARWRQWSCRPLSGCRPTTSRGPRARAGHAIRLPGPSPPGELGYLGPAMALEPAGIRRSGSVPGGMCASRASRSGRRGSARHRPRPPRACCWSPTARECVRSAEEMRHPGGPGGRRAPWCRGRGGFPGDDRSPGGLPGGSAGGPGLPAGGRPASGAPRRRPRQERRAGRGGRRSCPPSRMWRSRSGGRSACRGRRSRCWARR